jgi:hypothetical protein
MEEMYKCLYKMIILYLDLKNLEKLLNINTIQIHKSMKSRFFSWSWCTGNNIINSHNHFSGLAC